MTQQCQPGASWPMTMRKDSGIILQNGIFFKTCLQNIAYRLYFNWQRQKFLIMIERFKIEPFNQRT